MLTEMLLFVFFTFKISFIKKYINKNCPVNLNTNTTDYSTIFRNSNVNKTVRFF